MGVYRLDKLMSETRRLAKEYKQTTGQALPISIELAKYDLMNILGLAEPTQVMSGVDAVGQGENAHKQIQIKSRVIFDDSKSGHRIGSFNFDGEWNSVILVLMNSDYEPIEVYEVEKPALREEMDQGTNASRNKRGMMSVAKFRALGALVWSCDDGINSSSRWK